MARSRSIDYRVGFSGDTSQLEAAIKKATESLTKLGSSPDVLRRGLEGASRSALELSQHLNTAFNQDTGKLDLIKFQQSLKASGKSIQDYATSLRSLGPQGEQAFLEVASAIGKAELPLKRTNNLIKQFGVTLWNTARWRVTTGAINAIVGGMQQAMGYAKSLDGSLNNIRIVTGKSAEEMAAFAKEANSAAKALSTTTTTYTDASLIYYQQGLDNEAVRQRTETTIKMANVTGQSAETISSEMTAIWENFDDGTRSLESFADGMVALGATTAASSKEIAEGLQKFAPVADAVGLSFDYASAALTTIVANTRESASVAGTALKTLFSRLEGLKLGETLDDGTDLNKYSSALMSVGVNIKDVSGNLKDMDTILDELGAKWKTLAKDQQMALAETVGGVRQYTQLVALMDNWADFQKNLVTAQSSEGALQRQADIYAESWEAARKRIKAATEDIYDSFINADQFVKLDDMFTPLLTGIASAVDALGGLTGMLPLVVMLMNKAFGDKIAQSLRDMTVNIGLMTGAEQKRARALQQTIAKEADLLGISMEDNSMARTKVEILQEEVRLQAEINSKIDEMPAAQQEALNNEMQMVEILKQEALKTAEIAEARQQAVDDARVNILSGASNSRGITDATQLFGSHQIAGNHFIDSTAINLTNDLDDAVGKLTEQLQKSVQASVTAQSHISKLSKDFKGDADAANAATDAARTFLSTIGQPVKADAGIQEIIKKLREVKTEAIDARGALRTALTNLDIEPSAINTMVAAVARLTEAGMDSAAALEAVKNAAARTGEVIQASSAAYVDWADALVKVGTYASQAAMAIRAIGNLKDVFSKDSELKASEKISQGLMSIAMIAPMVAQSIKPITKSFQNLSKAKDTFDSVNKQVKILGKVSDDAAKGLNAIDNEIDAVGALPTLIADKGKAEIAAAAATKAHTEAQVEQTAATTALTAARTKLIATLGVTAAILAIVAVIAILIKKYKEAEERIKELNKAKMEAADKAKEEIESNQKLIDSYRELLATYQETGEGKDQLDAKARELADAYNVEGAALASLTGNYEEFLDKINQINKIELANKQKTLLEGANGSVNYNSDKISFGSGAAGALQQAGLSEYLRPTLTGYTVNLQISTQSYEELLDLQKKLEAVKDDPLIGDGVTKVLEEINTKLAQAKDYLSQAAVIEVQLKASDGSDISSYEDFKAWREKALGLLKNNSNFDTQLLDTSNIIKQAASDLGLDEWVQIQNVTEDIEAQLKKYPGYLEKAKSKFGEITSLDDAKIFEYLPWFQVNDDNFEEIYEQTKAYIKAQEMGAQVALKYADAEKLLQKIQSGSKLNVKDLEDYAKLFEGGTDEFIDFLTKYSPEEQEAKLNKMMQDSFAQQQRDRANRIAEIGESKESGGQGLLAQSEKSKEEAWQAIADVNGGLLSDAGINNAIKTVTDLQESWDLTAISVRNYYSELEKAQKEGKEGTFLSENKNPLEQLGLDPENLEADLGKLEEYFTRLLNINPYTEAVNKYQLAKDEVARLEKERNDTDDEYQLEAAAYERNTNLLIDQVKTLGDLNKLQKTRKVNTDQYTKGILNLAKTLPQATFKLKEYNAEVKENGEDSERAKTLMREIADIVEEDAWGQALAKIKEANTALSNAGIDLGIDKVAEKDIPKYREQLGKMAEAIREVTGATEKEVNEGWVEDHITDIEALLSGDVETIQSTLGTLRLALDASSEEFSTWANSFGLAGSQIKAVVNGLDGIEFDIDGYANMSQILSALYGVGLSATSVAEILTQIGNMDIGFKVSGIPNKEDFMVDASAYGLGTIFDETAYMKALEGASIQTTSSLKDIPNYYGGGGNGGGGGKKDAKDLKKDLKDIEDRYHEINRQLERQERVMSKLDKQIDRTYGVGRLKLFQQKQQEIAKTIDLLTQKSQEANGYLKEDKAVLEGITFDEDLNVKLFEGFDVQFGEGQEISNYKQVLQQIVDAYNEFIKEYEAAIAAGGATEELEKQKEQEDKIYEARLEALKKYEDSLDNVNTLAHNIEDELRKQEDVKLQEITYKMELVLDVREAKKQINEFSREIEESFGDALTHTTKAMIFDEDNARIEMEMLKHYTEEYEALKQRLAEANEYTDVPAIIDEMKNLQGNIIESGEALLEWLEKVENMYVEALDAAAERFKHFTDQIAHDTEVLDAVKELYALQGVTYKTQEGFDKLQQTSAGQYQGYLRQAQLNKQWYEDRAADLAEAEAALAGVAETDVEYDTLKKNRDALLAEVNEAQSAMLENSKMAMEAARQMYLDQVERLSYELEQRLTNGMGFDLLEEKYNHFLEESDRYLDPIEEGLETASWYTKLQKDIDKTSNTVYKDRLKALQEEIDMRRENNTLSQYDLDLLEAKYQVLQAEMALEDERNNKNQMRLVRDSNGNWNYQFTANPEDLATQEEELLKAKQNEYEITKNRYKDLNDEMLRMAREFAEADRQIREDMINGVLTEEEGQARLQELEEYYTKKAEFLTEELGIAREDMAQAATTSSILAAGLSESVLATSSEAIQEIVRQLKEDGGPQLVAAAGSIFSVLQDSLRENLVEKFGHTSEEVQQQIKNIVQGEDIVGTLEWLTKSFATGMENIVSTVEDNFIPAIKEYIPEAEDIFEEFRKKIKETADALGVDPDSLSKMTQNVTADIEKMYNQGKIAIDMMDAQLDAVRRLQDEYLTWADDVMAVVQSMRELAAAQAEVIESAAGIADGWGSDNGDTPTPDNPTPDNPTPDSPPAEEPTSNGQWPPSSGDVVSWTGNAPNRVFTVNGQSYRWGTPEADLLQKRLDQRYIEGAIDWVNQTFRFKTGGYTGTWVGDEGRLAFLDQKELVLNEQDTKNILEAVHIIRGISDTVLKNIAESLDRAGAASMAILGQHLNNALPPMENETTLEQYVTIEQVNFPNVTSSREIEEAFESLVNDAAQWARRRKS